MWQRGTGWGGFLITSQVSFSTCATVPRLMGTQGLVLGGCSCCGCIYPVLLLLLGSHRQELGFLPKGLVWVPLASLGLCRGSPIREDPYGSISNSLTIQDSEVPAPSSA